jgi:predicted small lipoprotein YifL
VTRAILLVLAALLLALSIAACGKKGPLEPPQDVPNTYPRTYPSE